MKDALKATFSLAAIAALIYIVWSLRDVLFGIGFH